MSNDFPQFHNFLYVSAVEMNKTIYLKAHTVAVHTVQLFNRSFGIATPIFKFLFIVSINFQHSEA